MGHILPKSMEDNPRWTGRPTARGISYDPAPTGNLVAPWSAKVDQIAQIDKTRGCEAADDRLCGACGTSIPADEPATFFSTVTQGFNRYEPPLHVACAGYAIRSCPHLREGCEEVVLAMRWGSEIDDEGGAFWIASHPSNERLDVASFLKRTRPQIGGER